MMNKLRSKAGYFLAVFIFCIGHVALAFSFMIEKPVSDTEKAVLKQLDINKTRFFAISKAFEPGGSAFPAEQVSLPGDKDDDGMADSWEKRNGFSPTNPNDAWTDADKDQVVNLFEYQLGSDPRNPYSPAVITVGRSSIADYMNLADAIDGCDAGSIIRIAKGTYKINYLTFDPKIVMLQGGWSSDFMKRDLKLYPVTLDGANKDEVLYFSSYSGKPVIILDGLKIIRGKGTIGGTVFLAQGSAFMKLSLFNCLFVQSGTNFNFCGVLNFTNWGDSLADRTVANTVIGGNNASGIYAQITENGRARWRVINSAIYGNKNGGGDNGYGIDAFTLSDGLLNAHIFNSVLWGNAQEDVNICWDIRFGIDHTDLGRALAEYGAHCVLGAGNLDANPGFIDSAHQNYHLKNSSPLINRGINKGLPFTDFEGEKRVKGVAPDIGPDELR